MSLFSLLLASTDWTARQSGEATGAGIAVAILLLGIIKCALIMRRPTTSKLCVSALLLVLLGWFLSALGNMASIVFKIQQGPLTALFGVIGVLLMLAALVTGIVGLATYDGNRFHQGRAQAIWAVVLGSLIALLMVGVIIFNALKSANADKVVHVDGARLPGGVIRNVEFNFSLEPSSSWAELKPEAFNKLACLALRRTNPEVFGMVLAERVPGSLNLDQLREIAKSNIATTTKVLNQSECTEVINGITFARLNTRAFLEAQGLTIEYEHWLATQRGFSWQIVFWTAQDRNALSLEAKPVMETFRILDPAMDGYGKGTLTDVARPELGYRTRLEGMGWAPWTDGGANVLFDFRAQRTNEALVVLPLRFEEEPPDMAALTRGLLSTLSLESTPEEEFVSKPWTPGHGGTGRELQIERDVGGDRYRYVLRVARGADSAHLIAGWSHVSRGDADLVRRALDAITLAAPVGEAPVLRPDQRKALGLVYNEAGLAVMKQGLHTQAAGLFKKGFQIGNDPTVLGNAGEMLERAGLAAEGRDLLGPHVEKFPANHHLGLRYARLQVLAGDVDGGNAGFLRLIENGLRDEDELLSWLQLLNEREHHPAALRAADAWVARHPTLNARRWQAQTYGVSGDHEKAVEILTKLHEENPGDRKLSLDLGEALNDAGENAKAAAISQEILADGSESPRALMILGWSQMGRKWYRDAKASFERAAKKQPENSDVQEAIRRASAALGQGNNSDIKEALAPVEVPAQVIAALGGGKAPADFGEGHASAWMMRATGYHFEKGKPLRRTVHRRVKILTTEGAGDFSSVEAKFQPLGERVFMNRLEVRDADGKTISQASLDDAYVRDPGEGTASDEKVLHMQVAGVQPGTTVEWQITYEDLSPSDGFEFQRHLFASGLPVAGEAVFVTGDIAAITPRINHVGKLEKIQSDGLIAWVARDQSAATFEPFAIFAERRCPMLWLGGGDVTWEKIGRDYLKQIEERLTLDPSVKKLAAGLVSGKTGEREKLTAIVRHVQKEISYKAIEFGVRARRPNAGAETIQLRYGDCKDTALLIHLLLRAVDIESHLALVNTDWEIQPDLPTLDQFNHMVVHVPSLGKNRLLDATDKNLDLASFQADGLWHSHALVLDPKRPHLIPPSAPPAPENCRVSSSRAVTIMGNDWRVEETLTLTGYYASWMRGAFTGLSPAAQSEKAQGLLADQGAARLHDFRFANIDEPGEPARVVLNYDISDGVTAGNTGVLPALWERDYLGTKFVKDRKTPFELIYPLHLTSEVIVKLPSPPLPKALEDLSRKENSEHCTWSLKTETRGNDVTLRFDFMAKPGTHQPSAYAAFHESWESARRALDRPLSW